MGQGYHIYGLVDPRTGCLRYVGLTQDLKKRLRGHRNKARQPSTCHRETWLKSIYDAGRKPLVVLLETCSAATVEAREVYWIAHYRAAGCDLTNATSGGERNKELTLEARARMSAALIGKSKGKPKSEEHRRHISEGQKGKIIPAEVRAKMSAAARVKIFTPEHRAAMGAARKGKPRPPEVSAKIAAARSQDYTLLSPAGETIHIRGLATFCREQGIAPGNLQTQSKKGLRSEGWFIVSEAFPAPRASRQGQRPS